MNATNKRLLISESRGDSNRCTPCRGKLDQHAMYSSHASPRMPGVHFLRAVPICGNLSWGINRVEQSHCSWESGLPIESTVRRWPIHGSVPNFSTESANEVVGAKPNIYQQPATRLTGPIAPVCDWYILYLLTEANLGGAGFPHTTLQPSRPAVSPFP
jgi:hypothetical protein